MLLFLRSFLSLEWQLSKKSISTLINKFYMASEFVCIWPTVFKQKMVGFHLSELYKFFFFFNVQCESNFKQFSVISTHNDILRFWFWLVHETSLKRSLQRHWYRLYKTSDSLIAANLKLTGHLIRIENSLCR